MHDAIDLLAMLLALVAMLAWLTGLVGCWRGRVKLSLLSCLVLFLLPVGMMLGENFFPDEYDYGFIPLIIVIWAAAVLGTVIAGLIFAAGSLWRRRKVS